MENYPFTYSDMVKVAPNLKQNDYIMKKQLDTDMKYSIRHVTWFLQ